MAAWAHELWPPLTPSRSRGFPGTCPTPASRVHCGLASRPCPPTLPSTHGLSNRLCLQAPAGTQDQLEHGLPPTPDAPGGPSPASDCKLRPLLTHRLLTNGEESRSFDHSLTGQALTKHLLCARLRRNNGLRPPGEHPPEERLREAAANVHGALRLDSQPRDRPGLRSGRSPNRHRTGVKHSE